ncbi:hypothetical protein [Mucilaginibacter psychrotolerans]|uniref:DUF4595 domain-containing protein n=1 Tax=Mucilaginibacter psychrotolerans TaxID=1524096 RepID=A0A4Y8SA99_9SPHI|nr:hypothetical protein [Mucilaginibacter psychrotolerans]TFF35550.1 hypothetical protein E2R66_18880 [Mucilaginibacter psychrotolerans]
MMRKLLKLSFTVAVGLGVLFSCKKAAPVTPDQAPQPIPVLSDAKQLTTYGFAKNDNPMLSADVVATVDETSKTVKATLPYGTDLTALKANFTISAKATLKTGSIIQVSGSTVNNFSQALTLTITAENGSMQNYAASISLAQPPSGGSSMVIKREEFAAGPPVQTIPILTADYTYNSSNLLLSYKDNYGTYLFDYDVNGVLISQTVKDNAGNTSNTLTYTLNTAKQVISITGTYGQTLENFSYGASGGLIKYTKSYFGVVKDTYEYTNDSKGRVKMAKYINSSDPAGTYTLFNYEYYDGVYDPDPMIGVFIRPSVSYGIETSTRKAYALKSYSSQKYDAIGVIGSSTVGAYTYTTNTDGYITGLTDGSGGALYKYTFK